MLEKRIKRPKTEKRHGLERHDARLALILEHLIDSPLNHNTQIVQSILLYSFSSGVLATGT